MRALLMRSTSFLRLPSLSICSGIFLCGTIFLGSGASLEAQIPATDFQIDKIDISMPTTPVITFSGIPKSGSNPKKWMEVEVSFFWKPRLATQKYSDDVVINYYVLLANKSAAFPQGSLLSGQVTHTGIPSKQTEQGDVKSVMYVSPRALEQFFSGKVPSSKDSAVIDAGVTITEQGKIVAEKSYKGSGAWWSQMQQTSGYLLNKDQTPFQPLYWDYYEPIKKP